MQRSGRRLAFLLATITPLVPPIAFADSVEGGEWHHGMMGWGGWFFGPMMMILFFALLIGAAIVVARLFGPDSSAGGGRTDQALEILRERFAKGEITREEFEEMRKTLD